MSETVPERSTGLGLTQDYQEQIPHYDCNNNMLRYLKRQLWAIIVAYMVGIHNFYKQEDKTPDDIVIKIEDIEAQEDSSPKD